MKFLRFVECFILVLFLLADVCLFLLGLCQRQLVNQMFYVKQDIVQLNPINQLLFSAGLFLLLCLFNIVAQKTIFRKTTKGHSFNLGRKSSRADVAEKRQDDFYYLVILTCISLGCGIVFAINCPYLAADDQSAVWSMAARLATGGTIENIDNSPYWLFYPNQRVMAMIYAVFIKLFHLSVKDQFAPRILNAIFLSSLPFLTYDFTYCIGGKSDSARMCSLLTFSFLPLFLYIWYIYPTLPAIPLSFGAASLFLNGSRKNIRTKLIYWLAADMLLIFLNVFYKGTLIFDIAVFVVLLFGIFTDTDEGFSINKKQWHRLSILLWGFCILFCLIGGKAVTRVLDNRFQSMTGLTFGEGLPTANWIAMGFSDGEKAINGAGSWDPEIQKLYVQGDPEATKELACESIRSSIRLLQKKDSRGVPHALSFFTEKMVREWEDPWFNSTKSIHRYETVPDRYRDLDVFLGGETIPWLGKLLTVFKNTIYLTAGVWTIYLLHKLRVAPDSCGLLSFYQLLPFVYFIGGFLFQFIWEAKSRYCLPYFVFLIPVSSLAISGFGSASVLHRLRKATGRYE